MLIGVAALSQNCAVRALDLEADHSGLLPQLLATGRIQVFWIAFGGVHALCVNYYASTRAARSEVLFENNRTLTSVFELLAQFPGVPHLICADFRRSLLNIRLLLLRSRQGGGWTPWIRLVSRGLRFAPPGLRKPLSPALTPSS